VEDDAGASKYTVTVLSASGWTPFTRLQREADGGDGDDRKDG